MNCVELQESLAEVEDGRTPEQRTHLQSCPSCVVLLQELDQIVAAAVQLRAADEPSPVVWNSIEIALRREGLIRPQTSRRSNVPSFAARWGRAGWLVPAAAMLLLSVGIYQHNRSTQSQLAGSGAMVTKPSGVDNGLNDDDLLQEVAVNAPAMRDQYQENLRLVNVSIHEAQNAVNEDPNDDEARRALMDAYEQKSMLFEMAMDRPLP